jgi:protein-tyrosine phosphatase
MKILMVCLGNICRSPLAQGIMEQKVLQAGLKWVVDSAGTAGYHVGEAPHPLSQKVGRLHGVDISRQQARQFRQEDMLVFDHIYVMDAENYQAVKRLSEQYWDAGKTDLILNMITPGQNRSVPDPWYGTEEGYHEVYRLLDQACDAIVQKYAPAATAAR